MRLRVYPVIFLFMALVHAAADETRIALVANSERARSVAELVAADLSGEQDIALVEREGLGTLFRDIETALLMGGMRGLTDQIRAHGADMFAVFSADEKEPGGSLILFDVETGVRLVDIALGGEQIGEHVQAASDAVRQAVAKRTRLEMGSLRTISMVALRSLDLPPTEEAFSRAVAYLLEQMIANAPDLVLLERRSLEWVNRERMHILPEAAARLEAGRLMLELEVRRAPDGAGRQAAVQIMNGVGERVAWLEAETAKADVHAMASTLFDQLAKTLEVTSNDTTPDVRREADRLFAEYLFLFGHRRYEAALERMEASAALGPERVFPYLASALLYVGEPLLRRGEADFARGLEYGEREMALRQNAQRQDPALYYRLATRGMSPHLLRSGYCRNYYGRLFTLRRTDISEELQLRQLDLQRAEVNFIVDRAVEREDAARYLPEPSRQVGLLWLQERPDSISAWFETEARQAGKVSRSRNVLHNRRLAEMGRFLREISRNGVRPDEPQVKEVARRLIALYDALNLEYALATIPPTLQSDLVWHVPALEDRDRVFPSGKAALAPPVDSAVHRAVHEALDWLMKQQLADGSWTVLGHSNSGNKTGATGLALLAYLASGEGVPDARYWSVVERGLRFLVERDLLRNGHFAHGFTVDPDHGIATYALCEAYALTGIPVLRRAAEKAAGHIVKSQMTTGALSSGRIYATSPHETNPVMNSHMFWMTQALIAARHVGLDLPELDPVLYKAAHATLRSFNAETGLFASNIPGGANWDSSLSGHIVTTPMPTLSLIQLGFKETPSVQQGLGVLKQAIHEDHGRAMLKRQDFQRYAMTRLISHGADDHWTDWGEAVYRELLETQHADGSWGAMITTIEHVLTLSVLNRTLLTYQSSPLALVVPAEDGEMDQPPPPWRSALHVTKRSPSFVIPTPEHLYVGFGTNLEVHRFCWTDFSRSMVDFDGGPLHVDIRDRRVWLNPSENERARTAFSSQHLFLGDGNGVWMLPRHGGAVRRISTNDGLPSNLVQSLAWMDGYLYLGLGARNEEGWLVRYNVETGVTEILLASGRIGSVHPLETHVRPVRFESIVTDLARGRILVLVDARDRPNEADEEMRSGLWEYRLTDQAWHRVVRTTHAQIGGHPGAMFDYFSSVFRVDRLFLVGGQGVIMSYDLETDDARVLWAREHSIKRIDFMGDTTSPLIGQGSKHALHFPYAITEDWLWSSNPFARGNVKTGEFELLPPVSAGLTTLVGRSPDKKHLMLYMNDGLWALELDDP